MPLKVVRNDITKVAADAIVNTANPFPVVGAGTDRAIHEAAGPKLLEARIEIGCIPTGCAKATRAFDLPAKYVLHTVSPAWIGGTHGEAALLRKAYDAALELADELHCASVAFPLMAAGSYGFPHDLALSVAIQAFTDFLMDHDLTIFLVLFNREAFGLASSLFDGLKSYVDDNYVDAQHAREYGAARPGLPLSSSASNKRKSSRAEYHCDGFTAANADLPTVESMASMAFEAPVVQSDSLAEYLRLSEASFSEYLRDLLIERGGKDSEVYKRAEVSKQLFSKILGRRDYQPTKSTAIQLAIGLQLDMNQTQKLLEKAGYSLTRSSKADLVVQYCIERKIYSVTFINEALSDCGLPLLKTGLKS